MVEPIKKIYERYKIPKNLQRHMLRVAAVGNYVVSQVDEDINSEQVTSALLLHDMGNLIKFNLTSGLKMFDEDERDLQHWKSIQEEMIDRYGPNEHLASEKIAREIGVPREIVRLISKMGTEHLLHVAKDEDLELKICTYADMRVGPTGFVSLGERFEDLIARYQGTGHILGKVEQTRANSKYCAQIERQLENLTSVSIINLPEKMLEKLSHEMEKFQVKTD